MCSERSICDKLRHAFNTVVDHLMMRWVIWSNKNLGSCFFTFPHQRAACSHKLGNSKWCSLLRPAVKMTIFSLRIFLFVLVAITDPFLFPTYNKGFPFNWTTKQDFLLQLIQLPTCICMCFMFSGSENAQGSFSSVPRDLRWWCALAFILLKTEWPLSTSM